MKNRYEATFTKFDRDYHQVVDRQYKKGFSTIADVIKFEHEGEPGYEYYLDGVIVKETGEQVNMMFVANPQSNIDVEI